MRYNYILEGYESEWHKTWDERCEYEDLKPGNYTFKVTAIDRDLAYSEQPASIQVTILAPPFYKKTTFLIGAILAAFFIPTGILAVVLVGQKKQAFEPISNPYIVGNPIRSKEMFFGRESDFEFVRAKLTSGSAGASPSQAGLVIVFAGERRSGKTSILFQILNGELGERFVPVLMDMQAMAVDSDAEFLERIASEINEALVGQTHRSAPTSTTFREGNPIRAFERFVGEAMEALDGKALLLLLDEYELIEAKIDDGTLRTDLITFFASLLEAHPRLSFIFTGSRHLEQRNVAYWRVLIGKSLYRRISFLSERDALRLITEPVADRVVYPRGIPERIIRLTGGQPFYTQVVCQNMMDRLNEVQRNRVRQEDVDAVAQELADNPLPQMIYFWDGLEQEQQSALSLLGEVLENSDRYASAQMLVNLTQEQNLGLELELSELEKVLDELFVREVLERERAGEGQYEYRFRVDLFRLWVRQTHSVWQTA
jgi:AAA+ ATPase superfamily predicted ATPase